MISLEEKRPFVTSFIPNTPFSPLNGFPQDPLSWTLVLLGTPTALCLESLYDPLQSSTPHLPCQTKVLKDVS